MVKLVKVRWDLKPPNIKDRIPESAGNIVVERCEKMVYSVHKTAKPRRRQGGKRRKKKPAATAVAGNNETQKNHLAVREVENESRQETKEGKDSRVVRPESEDTGDNSKIVEKAESGGIEQEAKMEEAAAEIFRISRGRRTNLTSVFNEQIVVTSLVVKLHKVSSFSLSDLGQPQLSSTPNTVSSGPGLEEIDNELVDLASKLDYDDFASDEEEEKDGQQLSSSLSGASPICSKVVPFSPASQHTGIKRLMVDRNQSIRLEWCEEGESSILDIAEYRQVLVAARIAQAKKIDSEKIEAKSPIICDLLRNGVIYPGPDPL
jgi:hypothetical protein